MEVDFIRKKRLVTSKKSHCIEIVKSFSCCKKDILTKNKKEKIRAFQKLMSFENHVVRSHVVRRFDCNIDYTYMFILILVNILLKITILGVTII